MTRLVLVNPNTSGEATAAMLTVARDALGGAHSIEGLTAAFGPALIVDEDGLALAASAVAALLPRLRAAAPDGVIVAAFGDPALSSLRTALLCPVTGIAEAGMAEAAGEGRSFAVVTTTPRLVAAIGASAAAYGHARLYRGTLVTQGDPRTLMADPQRLVEALAVTCDEAVHSLGAAAIVIGGGPLAAAARSLAGRVRVPLIEPVPAAARLALARTVPSA